MCSVSWFVEEERLSVHFNRDELKSRMTALPPVVRTVGRMSCIAPVDPEGQGTWIGVNTGGFACCLLNNYSRAIAAAHPAYRSRGLLVESILGCDSQEAALQSVLALTLAAFRPFHLILFQTGTAPVLCDWDGSRLRTNRLPRSSFFSSSSFDSSGVIWRGRGCIMPLAADRFPCRLFMRATATAAGHTRFACTVPMLRQSASAKCGSIPAASSSLTGTAPPAGARGSRRERFR